MLEVDFCTNHLAGEKNHVKEWLIIKEDLVVGLVHAPVPQNDV